MQEVFGLYKQLGHPNDGIGLIGATDLQQSMVNLIFKGTKEDIFKVKEFLEREHADGE